MKSILYGFFVTIITLLTGCDESDPHPRSSLTPAEGTLVVSAGAQPTGFFAEAGHLVTFTNVSLTALEGDVHVNGILVERTGYAQNEAFASVSLLNENGLAIGNPEVLDSLSNQATIGGSFVIPEGETWNLSAASTMAENLDLYSGQVAELVIVSVNAANVSGTFPITGTMLTFLKSNPCDGSQPALMIETSPNSPPDIFDVPGGTIGQAISVGRLTSIGGDTIIQNISLNIVGNSNISQVAIWNEMAQVGSVAILSESTITSVLLPQPITLPVDTYVDLIFKADFQNIGPGYPGIEGALVRVDATSTNMIATSTVTGNRIPVCGKTATYGVNAIAPTP